MAEEKGSANATGHEPKKPSLVKRILVGLLIVIVLLLGFVVLQPSDFRIARSETITAPPQAVFEKVNDFHEWDAWSPWAKLDPEMKKTYEGSPTGEGAIYTWNGNNEVGKGKMTIVESRPNELVRVKLEFIKPMAATNEAQFAFEPQEGDATKVTWSMTGKNSFVMKAVHLLMNMDKMLGGEFEKGLGQMKAAVEGTPKQ